MTRARTSPALRPLAAALLLVTLAGAADPWSPAWPEPR